MWLLGQTDDEVLQRLELDDVGILRHAGGVPSDVEPDQHVRVLCPFRTDAAVIPIVIGAGIDGQEPARCRNSSGVSISGSIPATIRVLSASVAARCASVRGIAASANRRA